MSCESTVRAIDSDSAHSFVNHSMPINEIAVRDGYEFEEENSRISELQAPFFQVQQSMLIPQVPESYVVDHVSSAIDRSLDSMSTTHADIREFDVTLLHHKCLMIM